MPAQKYETIALSTPRPFVRLATLNRPDAANAFNTRMATELYQAFEALALDPGDARCVVLTGAGDRAFCAGGDLKERDGMSDEAWRAQHLTYERMARALADLPMPLIGAINGAAYGGGCELAAGCDFIYAADSARFALTEVTIGIIPGAAGTQNLPRAVGERRAKEIILTGAPFTADEAAAWGLVNAVHPKAALLDAALDTAERIAANAPVAVRQAKAAVARGSHMPLRDGMAFEIEAYNRTVPTADRREGVRAFVEKRKPRFEGR